MYLGRTEKAFIHDLRKPWIPKISIAISYFSMHGSERGAEFSIWESEFFDLYRRAAAAASRPWAKHIFLRLDIVQQHSVCKEPSSNQDHTQRLIGVILQQNMVKVWQHIFHISTCALQQRFLFCCQLTSGNKNWIARQFTTFAHNWSLRHFWLMENEDGEWCEHHHIIRSGDAVKRRKKEVPWSNRKITLQGYEIIVFLARVDL